MQAQEKLEGSLMTYLLAVEILLGWRFSSQLIQWDLHLSLTIWENLQEMAAWAALAGWSMMSQYLKALLLSLFFCFLRSLSSWHHQCLENRVGFLSGMWVRIISWIREVSLLTLRSNSALVLMWRAGELSSRLAERAILNSDQLTSWKLWDSGEVEQGMGRETIVMTGRWSARGGHR